MFIKKIELTQKQFERKLKKFQTENIIAEKELKNKDFNGLPEFTREFILDLMNIESVKCGKIMRYYQR